MKASFSKIPLELALHELKMKGLLFEGPEFYSEIKKNTLKDFLKNEWKWSKKDTIKAIKIWIDKEYIQLNSDYLSFIFTQVIRREKNRIGGIING